MRSIGTTLEPRSATAAGYRRAAALLGAGYVALAGAAAAGWLRPLDLALGRAAHGGLPCAVLQAGDRASVLLAGEVSLVYAGLLALFCARRGRPLLGGWLVGLLLAGVAVEFLSKFWLYQPSPGALLGFSRAECYRAAYPLASVTVPNSLPSGYAIRAAYLGVLLRALLGARWPRLERPLGWGLGVGLAVLGATRVAIAWHWTSDVLAGLLLGAAMGCLALALADGFRWLRPTEASGRAA